MNYCGETTCEKEYVKGMYEFLKSALKSPDPDLPLRGPGEYKKDNLAYYNSVNGKLDSFIGQEIIRHDNNQMYKLIYHGGKIDRL
jgi:hypothetical protein